jgi:hypothetical protein
VRFPETEAKSPAESPTEIVSSYVPALVGRQEIDVAFALAHPGGRFPYANVSGPLAVVALTWMVEAFPRTMVEGEIQKPVMRREPVEPEATTERGSDAFAYRPLES